MIRRPPRSTRTDTPFPYTPLFRSKLCAAYGMTVSRLMRLAEQDYAPLVARADQPVWTDASVRSEEHTSELQSLMRISYAVFCLKKKKQKRSVKDQIKKNTAIATQLRES